ncbi:MAG TPA: hypothetical protein GXX24_02185 [Paracoccus solventivorans]|uniref:Uncharacterized protein n=1 Tax=Paracoccus solventivorans TaxID=53463 RepID=A0A832PKZ3_9RHOB|nr:hypothetical protein [Paracoccus solventivorans]HHW32945.1 hypothetical protein [Paracoccus solventivorans]
MALPPRVYFTLHEAAARWDCALADIAGWASVEKFDIVTAIAPVASGMQIVAGYVVVPVTDILQMFRRCGTGPTRSHLRRMRPKNQGEWIMIDDPAGIEVTLADLLIMAEDVRRFETECDLLRRPASHIGSTTRYDWDGMYIALMVRIHDQGLPATQAEWLGEVQDWFVATSESGEVPDERTIRRRLTPIWKALRGSA